jgi:hypothetical protein
MPLILFHMELLQTLGRKFTVRIELRFQNYELLFWENTFLDHFTNQRIQNRIVLTTAITAYHRRERGTTCQIGYLAP